MRQWTIDAFATAPFRGNPACVVEPFDAWPDAAWMQDLAAENNQAETAFLLRTADPARFGLRWFTPKLEVSLCGHATLAATHALFSELGSRADQIIFETLSGPLTVSVAGDLIEMSFPAAAARQIPIPPSITAVLGVAPFELWTAKLAVAVVDGETALRELTPDLAAVAALSIEGAAAGALCVAALADPDRPYQVVSRFFAPGFGIPEDPATGSAHCILAPLFATRLGRPRLAYHQAYPGRGGDLDCEVAGERVLLRGQAVTVIESRLRDELLNEMLFRSLPHARAVLET